MNFVLGILFSLIANNNFVQSVTKNKSDSNWNITKPEKSLTVIATSYEPYVYIDDVNQVCGGIEYHLVKAIAKKLNRELLIITEDVNEHSIEVRNKLKWVSICLIFRMGTFIELMTYIISIIHLCSGTIL